MVNLKVRPHSSNSVFPPQITDSEQKIIRILLVDDQNLIRQKLRISLEPEADLEVIGSIEDGQTALQQVEALHPDIVLMDIEMPGMDGLTATQTIREHFANTKVIVFSSYDNKEYIDKALIAGAKGYLLKTTPIEEIIHAIRFVHKGYLHFGPGLFEKLPSRELTTKSPHAPEGSSLESIEIIKHDQTSSLKKYSAADGLSLTAAKLSKSNGNDWSSMTRGLIDTLPQIWTRGLLYFLMVFMGIVLPWAMFSQVDETGSARGRLEPQGKVFTVDAPVTGTVAEVLVEEGQLVQDQQPLLELESEPIESELKQVQTRLEAQQNELAQLKFLKNQLILAVNTQKQQNRAQQLEKQAQVDQARQNFQSLSNNFSLQKAEKQSQVDQARQNFHYSQTALELAKIAHQKSQEELERYTQAKEQGIVAEIQVVEIDSSVRERKRLLEQALSDAEQAQLRLLEQQSSYEKLIHEANSDIEQAKLRLQEQEKSYQGLVHSGKIAVLRSEEQLKELERQIGTLASQIKENQSKTDALNYQLEQRVVKAPASGSIFQLPIKKPGVVVNPGDLVAEVAPQQSSLILKAQMTTAESGSLDKEMPVKLKFDAYPFQDYGVVEGKLVSISPTTKVTETENGQVVAYELEIELEQTYIQAKNKRVALRPGQTATAEVIVRQRRLIDFVIEPFKKLNQGGLEL